MGKSDYYASGQYNFICDQCGTKNKSKDMRKQWDGLIVCPRCFDKRHPQEFVKGVKDSQTVPISRPDTTATFVAEVVDLEPTPGGSL